MNRKTITMILAVVIIGAFFLPYFSLGGLFKMSGLDIITGGSMGGNSSGSADRFILLLTPIAGVLLLVGALNNEKYIPSRSVLGILALVGWIYPLIRGLMEGGSGMSQIFKFMGIGFWLGLVAAIAVLVYNPKS
jgi:hypothetical protein